jgi:hypothetical protein
VTVRRELGRSARKIRYPYPKRVTPAKAGTQMNGAAREVHGVISIRIGKVSHKLLVRPRSALLLAPRLRGDDTLFSVEVANAHRVLPRPDEERVQSCIFVPFSFLTRTNMEHKRNEWAQEGFGHVILAFRRRSGDRVGDLYRMGLRARGCRAPARICILSEPSVDGRR